MGKQVKKSSNTDDIKRKLKIDLCPNFKNTTYHESLRYLLSCIKNHDYRKTDIDYYPNLNTKQFTKRRKTTFGRRRIQVSSSNILVSSLYYRTANPVYIIMINSGGY